MTNIEGTQLSITQTELLVSIIMPCYNVANFIDVAILSVINQTYRNWELLICDDASNDGSAELAEEWAIKHGQIFFMSNKFAKGAAGARNTCLGVARGRYIAFLDADDLWYPDKLTKQIDHMISTGSSFCVSYYDVMDEDENYRYSVKTPKNITQRHMMYSNFIPCLTAIYDSRFLGKVPTPNIKKRNDYALWLTLFCERGLEKATSVPYSLASYRQNGYGLSSSGYESLIFYYLCLRKYAGRTIFLSLYFSMIYLTIILVKKRFPNIYNLFSMRI